MSALVILILSFASDGDREKFEYLYRQYKNLMLHKAYGVLRDPMLAEDAVSEAFLRIYKNLGKIEDPASNRSIAFVVTITKNCALTLLEKRKKAAAEPLHETVPSDADVEGGVLERLTTAEIMALVDALGEEHKSVFLLKYAYDLPHREIGRLLEMSENNVTVRLHRAKKKLAVLLREKGYTYEG